VRLADDGRVCLRAEEVIGFGETGRFRAVDGGVISSPESGIVEGSLPW